ncbi:hypothetical protein FPV67DRAFT_1587292 [Lyophyllum atratum]|nr:hypothetical protein FPV67DRAFT_1587292 [Lyophyllum atratum]
MAPRTRSRKGPSREEALAHQRAVLAGPVNTTGLPALPVELLLETISYFPTIPIPIVGDDMYSTSYLDRPQLCRALSQTCRSLRSRFLPLSWQRIEVCVTTRKKPKNKSASQLASCKRYFATELVRQLEIVTIRDPSLAAYVKIVNVRLSDVSSDRVMVELVRCLELFPNLHTVQLLEMKYDYRTGICSTGIYSNIRDAFRGKQFSSVHTLVVPSFIGEDILHSFPGARFIKIRSLGWHMSMLEKVVMNCREVTELRGFEHVDYSDSKYPFMEDMIKGLPKTRHITLNVCNPSLTTDVIRQLSQFPNLSSIELEIGTHPNANRVSVRVRELRKRAQAVLRALPPVDTSGPKRRVVLTRNSRPYKTIIVE